MALSLAWHTAYLVRAKRPPSLARLLRRLRRKSEQEKAEILADVAAADAEFARIEAAARARSDAAVNNG